MSENVVIREPYELSVWLDELIPEQNQTWEENDIKKTGIILEHYEERKVAIIGANDMDTPFAARNPNLILNVNGSVTLTFEMFYRCFDEWYGEEGDFRDNPYTSLLNNEAKVKFKFRDEWYDLLIKKVEENSENYTFKYTTSSFFINELSKNGFKVELDVELENNQGTVTDLALKIMKETDWIVDVENSDILVQTITEPIYAGFLSKDIRVEKVADYMPDPKQKDTVEDIEIIRTGERVYFFYSDLQAEAPQPLILYRPLKPMSEEDAKQSTYYFYDTRNEQWYAEDYMVDLNKDVITNAFNYRIIDIINDDNETPDTVESNEINENMESQEPIENINFSVTYHGEDGKTPIPDIVQDVTPQGEIQNKLLNLVNEYFTEEIRLSGRASSSKKGAYLNEFDKKMTAILSGTFSALHNCFNYFFYGNSNPLRTTKQDAINLIENKYTTLSAIYQQIGDTWFRTVVTDDLLFAPSNNFRGKKVIRSPRSSYDVNLEWPVTIYTRSDEYLNSLINLDDIDREFEPNKYGYYVKIGGRYIFDKDYDPQYSGLTRYSKKEYYGYIRTEDYSPNLAQNYLANSYDYANVDTGWVFDGTPSTQDDLANGKVSSEEDGAFTGQIYYLNSMNFQLDPSVETAATSVLEMRLKNLQNERFYKDSTGKYFKSIINVWGDKNTLNTVIQDINNIEPQEIDKDLTYERIFLNDSLQEGLSFKTIVQYIETDSSTFESIKQDYLAALKQARNNSDDPLHSSYCDKTDEELEQICDRIISDLRYSKSPRVAINTGVAANRDTIKTLNKGEEYIFAISLGRYKEGEQPPEYKVNSIEYGSSPPDARYRFVSEEDTDSIAYEYACKELAKDYKENPIKYVPFAWQPGGELYQREYNKAYNEVRQQYLNVFYDKGLKGELDARFTRVGGKDKHGIWRKGAWNNGSIVYRTLYRKAITEIICGDNCKDFWTKVIQNATVEYLASDGTIFEGKISQDLQDFEHAYVRDIFATIKIPAIPTSLFSDLTVSNFRIETIDELDDDEKSFFASELSSKNFTFKKNKIFGGDGERTDGFGVYVEDELEKLYVPKDFDRYDGEDINNKTNYHYPNYADEQMTRIFKAIYSLIKSNYMDKTFGQMLSDGKFKQKAKKAIRKAIRELWSEVASIKRENNARLEKTLAFPKSVILPHGGYTYQKWASWWNIYASEKAKEKALNAYGDKIQNQSTCVKFNKILEPGLNNAKLININSETDLTGFSQNIMDYDEQKQQLKPDRDNYFLNWLKAHFYDKKENEEESNSRLKLIKFRDVFVTENGLIGDGEFEVFLNQLVDLILKIRKIIDYIGQYKTLKSNEEAKQSDKDEIKIAYYDYKINQLILKTNLLINQYNDLVDCFDCYYFLNPFYLKMLCDNNGLDGNLIAADQPLRIKYGFDKEVENYFTNWFDQVSGTTLDQNNLSQYYNNVFNALTATPESIKQYNKIIILLNNYGGITSTQYTSDYIYLFTKWLSSFPDNYFEFKTLEERRNAFDSVLCCTIGNLTIAQDGSKTWEGISLSEEWPCTDEFLEQAIIWKTKSNNQNLTTYTYKHMPGSFDILSSYTIDKEDKDNQAPLFYTENIKKTVEAISSADGLMIPVNKEFNTRKRDYYVKSNKYVPIKTKLNEKTDSILEQNWTEFMAQHGNDYIYHNGEYFTLTNYWNTIASLVNQSIKAKQKIIDEIDNSDPEKEQKIQKIENEINTYRNEELKKLCEELLKIQFYEPIPYFRGYDNDLDGMSETWLAMPNADHSKGGSYFLENGDPVDDIRVNANKKINGRFNLDYNMGYFRPYNESIDREYIGTLPLDGHIGETYIYDQSYELFPCYDGIGYYYPSNEEQWVKDADQNNEGKLFGKFTLRKNDYQVGFVPHSFDKDNGEQLFTVTQSANGGYVKTSDINKNYLIFINNLKTFITDVQKIGLKTLKGINIIQQWFRNNWNEFLNWADKEVADWLVNDNYLTYSIERLGSLKNKESDLEEALEGLEKFPGGLPIDFVLIDSGATDANGNALINKHTVQSPYGRWLRKQNGENTETMRDVVSYTGYYFNTRGGKIIETDSEGKDFNLEDLLNQKIIQEVPADETGNYTVTVDVQIDFNDASGGRNYRFSRSDIEAYINQIQDNVDYKTIWKDYCTMNDKSIELVRKGAVLSDGLAIGAMSKWELNYYKYDWGQYYQIGFKGDYGYNEIWGLDYSDAHKNLPSNEDMKGILEGKEKQYYIKYFYSEYLPKKLKELGVDDQFTPRQAIEQMNWETYSITKTIEKTYQVGSGAYVFDPFNNNSQIPIVPFTKYHWYQVSKWGKERYDLLPALAAKRPNQKGDNFNLFNINNDSKQQLYTYIPKEEIDWDFLNKTKEEICAEVNMSSLIDIDTELSKVKTNSELYAENHPILGKIRTWCESKFLSIRKNIRKLTRKDIGKDTDISGLHDYTETTMSDYISSQLYIKQAFLDKEFYLVSDNKDDYFTSIKDDDWSVTTYEPIFKTTGQAKVGDRTCYFYDIGRNYFRPYKGRTDYNFTLFDLKLGSNTPVFWFNDDPNGHWMYFAANDWYIPINKDRFTTPKRYKKVRDFDNGGYVLDNGNFVNFDGYMTARTKTFKLDYDNLEVSFCDSYNFDATNFAVDLTKANVPNGVTAATYDENKKKYLYFDCSKTDDEENFGYFDTTVVTDSIIDDKKTFERWVYWKAEVQENFSLTENLVNPIGMVFSSKTDKDYAFIGTQLFKYYPYYANLTYQKTEVNKEDSNEPEFAEDFVVKKMVIPGEIVDTDELSYQSYYIYDPDEMNDVDNITYEYVGPEPFDNGWAYDYDEKCQKIRSIKGKESNYFNLLQSLCETFECWVDFQVEHDPDTGQIVYRNTPIYIEKIKDEEGNYIDTPIEEEDETKSLIQSMELTTQKYPYNCIEEIPIEVKKDFITLKDKLCDNDIPEEEKPYTVAGYYDKFVQNYEGTYVQTSYDVTKYEEVENIEDHAAMDRYSHLKKTDKQIEFEKRQKAIAFFEDEANAEKYFTKKYIRVPQKKIIFKEYVGKDNYAGFKYGVNLKSTKRNIDSAQFTSRIVVKPNNNKYAENKFCSIQRAQDNFLKENFFYNFDYYIQHGLLKNTDLINDLYSDNDKHLGYFTKLHFLNQDLDTFATRLADLMISIDKLEADYQTAALGRQSATEEIQKLINLIQGNYDTYGQLIDSPWTFNKSKQYVERAEKGVTTLAHDYDATFYINGIATTSTLHIPTTMLTVDYPKYNETLRTWFDEMDVYQNKYTAYYNAELKFKKQLDDRKAEKARLEELQDIIVKKKSELNELFYHKYSRYIQEGSWTSNEYLDDNLYFLDALSVLRNSAFPKVSYQIGVVDLYPLEDYQVFDFRIGDRTYVEDTEFFGYVDSTGRPAQEEIVVTEISFFPEDPIKNAIKVQNYRTQFEDLFKRITAQSQQMKFSESNYGASSTSLLGGGAGLVGGNLVTNSGVTDIPNITMENGKITLGKNGVELLLDGDSISFRRGDRIIQVASVRGTAADQLVGQLSLDTLTMGSSSSPGLKLDRLGLSAYAIQDDGTVNYGKFVRHDQYGLYGIDMGVKTRTINDTFTGGLDEIEDQASFALTWNGFMLRSGDRNNRVKIGTDTDIRMQVTEGSNWKDRLIIGRMTDKNNEEYYGFRILNNNNEVVMETEPDGELYLKRKLRIANFSPTYAAVDTDTLIQQTDENGDTTYVDPNPDIRNLESRVNLGIVELFRRNITSVDGNRITTYTKEDTIPNYYDSATYLTKVLSIAANMETLDEEKAFEQFRDDQVREYYTYVPYTPTVNDTTPLYIYNENLGYQPYVINNSLDTNKWETSETNETDESEVEIRESTELQLYRKIEQTGLLAQNETFALFDNGCLVAKNAYIEGNIRATTGKVGALNIEKDGTLLTDNYNEELRTGFKIDSNGYLNINIANIAGKVSVGKDSKIIIDGENKQLYSKNKNNDFTNWQLLENTATFNNVVVRGTLEAAVFKKNTVQAIGGILLVKNMFLGKSIIFNENSNIFSIQLDEQEDFNEVNEYFNEHDYYQIIKEGDLSKNFLFKWFSSNKEERSINFLCDITNTEQVNYLTSLVNCKISIIHWDVTESIKKTTETTQSNSFGIVINGSSRNAFSDSFTLSLFENEIIEDNNTITLNARKPKLILGKLPQTLDPVFKNIIGLLEEEETDYVPRYGLYAQDVLLTGSLISKSQDGYIAGISTSLPNNSDIIFFAGCTTNQNNDFDPNNSVFKVTKDGELYATKGYFSGTVESSQLIAPIISGNGNKQYALQITDSGYGNTDNEEVKGFAFGRKSIASSGEVTISDNWFSITNKTITANKQEWRLSDKVRFNHDINDNFYIENNNKKLVIGEKIELHLVNNQKLKYGIYTDTNNNKFYALYVE